MIKALSKNISLFQKILIDLNVYFVIMLILLSGSHLIEIKNSRALAALRIKGRPVMYKNKSLESPELPRGGENVD